MGSRDIMTHQTLTQGDLTGYPRVHKGVTPAHKSMPRNAAAHIPYACNATRNLWRGGSACALCNAGSIHSLASPPYM